MLIARPCYVNALLRVLLPTVLVLGNRIALIASLSAGKCQRDRMAQRSGLQATCWRDACCRDGSDGWLGDFDGPDSAFGRLRGAVMLTWLNVV